MTKHLDDKEHMASPGGDHAGRSRGLREAQPVGSEPQVADWTPEDFYRHAAAAEQSARAPRRMSDDLRYHVTSGTTISHAYGFDLPHRRLVRSHAQLIPLVSGLGLAVVVALVALLFLAPDWRAKAPFTSTLDGLRWGTFACPYVPGAPVKPCTEQDKQNHVQP